MKFENENQERKWHLICEYCKKHYTVTLNEVTLKDVFQSYTVYTCNCPSCGKRDYVRDIKY